jgi:hypothetical protein
LTGQAVQLAGQGLAEVAAVANRLALQGVAHGLADRRRDGQVIDVLGLGGAGGREEVAGQRVGFDNPSVGIDHNDGVGQDGQGGFQRHLGL